MNTMTLPALKKPTTLADSVEDTLCNYIIQNNLRPGDHLPSEEEFATNIGVSRNIVREALSRLKSYGYISSRRRGGIVVESLNVNRDFQKILVPQLMTDEALANVLEMRILLEVGIIDTLFEKISQKDIDELERIVRNDPMDKSGLSEVDTEIRFHSRVFEITGNATLANLQEALLPVYRYVKNSQSLFEKFNANLSTKGGRATHRDMLDALKSGDRKKYEDVVRRHLYAYGEYVRAIRQKYSSK